jgi:hypothetical protein
MGRGTARNGARRGWVRLDRRPLIASVEAPRRVTYHECPTRGRGSVVEHHLAKVGVAGSNPVVRSRSEGSPCRSPSLDQSRHLSALSRGGNRPSRISRCFRREGHRASSPKRLLLSRRSAARGRSSVQRVRLSSSGTVVSESWRRLAAARRCRAHAFRRGGRVVRQGPAKPRTPVRFRSPPRVAFEPLIQSQNGRLAQRESASLTRKRSEVQIL